MIDFETANSLLIYNHEIGTLVWRKFRNQHALLGSIAGNPGNHGYAIVTLHGKRYLSHRIMWLLYYGRWPKHEVDHIDQNKLNNRISNLREVTGSENSRNKGLLKRNTSGFCGVYWRKDCQKWAAKIRYNGLLISLGSFLCFEDAVAARQAANVAYGFHKNHGTADRKHAQREEWWIRSVVCADLIP